MPTARNYINGAPLLTLSVAVDTIATTLEVSSTAGFPTAPFTLALERGTSNEEVVLCTATTATSFTVTRAYDGTTGKSHSIGAAVEHTTSAQDYSDANDHVNSTADGIHTQYVPHSVAATAGSMLVGDGADMAELGVGAEDTALVVIGGVPAWAQISGANLKNGIITLAHLTDDVQKGTIVRQGSAPTVTDGRIYFNTSSNRWFGRINGIWERMPFGAGEIKFSTAAPSGGTSGDIWFRY